MAKVQVSAQEQDRRNEKKQEILTAFRELLTTQAAEAGLFIAAYKGRMQIAWSPERCDGESPHVVALDVLMECYCGGMGYWTSKALTPSLIEPHLIYELEWAMGRVLDEPSRKTTYLERFCEKRDTSGDTTTEALCQAFRVYVEHWDHLSPDPW